MDFQIFDMLAPISLFLLMMVALKLGRNLTKTMSTPNIPPGPWKLPMIGNIPHLVTSTPHHRLRDLAKKYGPLMHLQLGQVSTIVVSSAECAKEVMKTHDLKFSTRPQILAGKIIGYDHKTIAFAPYGNYWRQLRKICTLELFTLKRINSFRPIREEELTNFIKRIASAIGSTFNLSRAVHSLTYAIVSRAAFGSRCKDLEEFISLTEEVVKTSGGFDIGEFFPSAPWIQVLTGFKPNLERLFVRNDKILQSIINEHKDASKPKAKGEVVEDMIDILLKFQDMDGENDEDVSLTDDHIKAVIENIFAAGGETSATSINWAMSELIRHPRVMKKAQAEVREVFNMKGRVDETCINEMKYLKAVAKETMRLHPPVPLLLPRECGQACEIDGYHIPVKSKVIVNVWAIGRDPKYWTEPERFFPERFIDSSIDYKGNNFEFIPFGAGRRICPGGSFGLINVEVALAFLLYHFDWKLPNGMKTEELDMSEQFGLTVKRKKDLHLIPSLAT